jgi:predicted site-specific integrase-resolvase
MYSSPNSSTTFLTITTVAKAADIPRATLYTWVQKGIVPSTCSIEGTPIFTPEEMKETLQIVKERKKHMNILYPDRRS